jgi:REP element-mobilizing transposase RayT
MSQSLSQTWVHIIFSTKDRKPFLYEKEMRERVFAYLGGVCRDLESAAVNIGGVADHVHILCSQSKNIAQKDLLRHLKQGSSKWIKQEWPHLSNFYWQGGYGAFSVSPSHVDLVRDYIARQEEHHQSVGFQDEYRTILKKYKIPYDERYVWD